MSDEPQTIRERIYCLLEQERQRSGGWPPVLLMGYDVYLKLDRELVTDMCTLPMTGPMRKYMGRLIYIVPVRGMLELGYEDWHQAEHAARVKEPT